MKNEIQSHGESLQEHYNLAQYHCISFMLKAGTISSPEEFAEKGLARFFSKLMEGNVEEVLDVEGLGAALESADREIARLRDYINAQTRSEFNI